VRILFLAHRLPYAPNRGDRVRAYHLLRYLSTFADVDVIALTHDEEEAAHAHDLASVSSTTRVVPVARAANLVRSALAWPTRRPLTHVMLYAGGLQAAIADSLGRHAPSVVFAYCTGIAPAVFVPPLRDLPVVLDMVDVDSAKWATLARSSPLPRALVYRREAHLLSRFEIEAARRAFATLVVTSAERDALRAIVPDVRIEVVPNGVDVEHLAPRSKPADSATVLFCGVMNYGPNAEAAVWLGRDVWPKVRRRHPKARLQLVGSSPTRRVMALADARAGIEVTGHVPDVRPYLWQAAVAAAPLFVARGVQNKVLEAIAAGLPAVVTPVVFGGLPFELRPACTTAGDAESFAEALAARLDESPQQRRARAGRADVARLAWPRQLAQLESIVTAAAEQTVR
jgi:sugar transferase (PEP-CTERM/EpsH1 system associated)